MDSYRDASSAELNYIQNNSYSVNYLHIKEIFKVLFVVFYDPHCTNL
jgi:hypothetical protein